MAIKVVNTLYIFQIDWFLLAQILVRSKGTIYSHFIGLGQL
jgi:hypothetical protein